jgi:hypothetical protein
VNREELIKEILDTCPDQEWCSDLFWNKYGRCFFGIGDGYDWNENALNNASDEELWKILALCSTNWYKKYRKWYEEASKRLQKVYEFARECRKYNIQTSDTSYESNFIMLDKALEFIKKHKT